MSLRLPALHATHAGIWLAGADGELREASRGEAIARAAETPHIILNAPLVGQRLGYPELAPPVASHPVTCLLDESRFPRGWPSVLVAIADRHVNQSFVTIDERIDDQARRHPEYAASLDAARSPAHALEAELAEVTGLTLPDLVARLRDAWEAGA